MGLGRLLNTPCRPLGSGASAISDEDDKCSLERLLPRLGRAIDELGESGFEFVLAGNQEPLLF